MAAYAAARNGNDVTIFEKNNKCGKKIYITGKGRCNMTNAVPPDEFLKNVVTNPKFLTGAVYKFSPDNLTALFESYGLNTKVERGNRVFPVSDKASDVTKCLEKMCLSLGVKIILDTGVVEIEALNGTMSDIIAVSKGKTDKFYCDSAIVCTGGISYPSTGSDGDGYKFAKDLGHNVVELKPSLCGFNLKGDYFKPWQGLSLKNVAITATYRCKAVQSFFGECLFTHFGISGPIVLSLSCHINRLNLNEVTLSLDLKPALTYEQLDARLVRDFSASPNKSLATVLKGLLPSAMIAEVLKRVGICGDLKVNSVNKEQRAALLKVLKSFEMRISSLRSFDEAIVTSGGVNVKEVNPKTMESKLVKGLYFCGEVLDVDAYTGGFNLQIAFSTGFAAGSSIKD